MGIVSELAVTLEIPKVTEEWQILIRERLAAALRVDIAGLEGWKQCGVCLYWVVYLLF